MQAAVSTALEHLMSHKAVETAQSLLRAANTGLKPVVTENRQAVEASGSEPPIVPKTN